MNWQSLVIIGVIVILFIILMIINASTADLDQDNAEEELSCLTNEAAPDSKPEGVNQEVSQSTNTTS